MKYIKILLLLSTLFFTIGCSSGSVPKSDNGLETKSQTHPYKIYVGKEATEAERFAASELSHYLSEATGTTIPVTTDYTPGTNGWFIVGTHNDYAAKLQNPPSADALGENGYELRKEGNNLLITGAYDRGTLYGVYGYLRKYAGWEWYSTDDPGTLKEKLSAVPLPQKSETDKPRFLYREVFAPEAGDEDDLSTGDFSAKMMLNGQLNSRTINRLLTQKHGWGTDYRNDIFNLGTDLSTDNARVLEAVAAIREWRENSDDPRPENLLTYCSFEHNDGGLEGGSSEPVVDFTRKVAEQTAPLFPHLRVMATAYLWSLEPPETVSPLPQNAGVQFAPIEMDWSKAINEGSYNKRFYDDLNGWSKVTDHIWSWLYTTNFNGYLQPMPTIYATAKTIKSMAKNPKVEGIFLQDSFTTRGGSFTALHSWVYGKLMWDPSLDTDKLIREFCDGYYGKEAGKLLYTYIVNLHESQKKYPSIIHTKSNVFAPYLHAHFLLKSEKMLEEAAQKATENPRFLRHVQLAQMGIDYVMLLNEAKLKQQAAAQGIAWADKHQRRYDRFKYIAEHIAHLSGVSEGDEDISDFLDAVKEPAIAPKSNCPQPGIPQEKCIDFHEAGFTLSGAYITYDPKASDHRTARLPGDTLDDNGEGGGAGVWGIQIPYDNLLPQNDNHWYLYAAVRATPNPEYDFTADPDPVLFRSGISGDEPIEYHMKDFEDDAYHIVQLSPYPQYQDNSSYIWFAPTDVDDITAPSPLKNLYVDRIFAVKTDD